jgi:hypothetical protein
MIVDLHTHTTASDGTDSPEELVRLAAAAGLAGVAITDHDTLEGSDEGAIAAEAIGLPFLRGLELSTRLLDEKTPQRRTAHILGFFPRSPGAAFRDWLRSLRAARRARNVAVIERLRGLGFELTLEEAERFGRNITGRPHIARVMAEKNYVANLREAFDNYLREGAPAYIEREDPSAREGIERILQAGGIPSLAHLGRMHRRDAADEESLLRQFSDWGLRALEVWHSDHDPKRNARYLAYTVKYGLAATGGSDYHGHHKPSVRLGLGRAGCPSAPIRAWETLTAAMG